MVLLSAAAHRHPRVKLEGRDKLFHSPQPIVGQPTVVLLDNRLPLFCLYLCLCCPSGNIGSVRRRSRGGRWGRCLCFCSCTPTFLLLLHLSLCPTPALCRPFPPLRRWPEDSRRCPSVLHASCNSNTATRTSTLPLMSLFTAGFLLLLMMHCLIWGVWVIVQPIRW